MILFCINNWVVQLACITRFIVLVSLNLLNFCLAPLQTCVKTFLIGVLNEANGGYEMTLCQILESLAMNRFERKH